MEAIAIVGPNSQDDDAFLGTFVSAYIYTNKTPYQY
jgi:hypothetical protein